MKYEELKNKLNINNVFIAPVMVVVDTKICEKNGNGVEALKKIEYIYKMTTKIVYRKKIKNIYRFVDLETNKVYLEQDEIGIKQLGEMYISESHVIPFNIFVRQKYKNKCIDRKKIIEIGNFVIRDDNTPDLAFTLNSVDYNNIFISVVYDKNDKVIKSKAVVYKLRNQLIDLDTKETYLLDDGIVDKSIEADLKFVNPNDLILMNDYMSEDKSTLLKNKKKRR